MSADGFVSSAWLIEKNDLQEKWGELASLACELARLLASSLALASFFLRADQLILLCYYLGYYSSSKISSSSTSSSCPVGGGSMCARQGARGSQLASSPARERASKLGKEKPAWPGVQRERERRERGRRRGL